jgi:hypothetical protein
MRQLAIQILLIVGILAVAWRLLGSYGQRAQALRRIGLLLFAAFAVWSILDPNILNQLADVLGIGRGADLVLYGLVLAFFGFVVTTFRRFRDMEVRYTRLARRIALDETPPPTRREPAATGLTPSTAGPEVRPQAGVSEATPPATGVETTPRAAESGEPGEPGEPDVTSTTPHGGDNGLGTPRPERLTGSPTSSPSMKAADAD